MTDTTKIWECKAALSWGLTTDPDYDDDVTSREDAEDYALASLYDDLSDLFLRGEYEDFRALFSVEANCVDEVDTSE